MSSWKPYGARFDLRTFTQAKRRLMISKPLRPKAASEEIKDCLHPFPLSDVLGAAIRLVEFPIGNARALAPAFAAVAVAIPKSEATRK
jgi:hypothetical protein